jgi:hypothetical protein
MKCSSLKYSGSKTKILSLSDTTGRIDLMMQSPQLLLTGRAPTGPHLFTTAVTILRHVCTHLNLQEKPEQLKFSKTDPSTWP